MTEATLLGSGGWFPTPERATSCVLLRRGDRALVLDAGTGLGRLAREPQLIAGVERLDVVLTHFHLDHVAGLGALPALGVEVGIRAPGRWLYGRASAEILAPLVSSPLSPFEPGEFGEISELSDGEQAVGPFTVSARAQPRHYAPTAGLRVEDELAVVTDTAYEAETARFVAGVAHLLHEAWSLDDAESRRFDASARDAGRTAVDAGVRALTLVHLDPRLQDHTPLLDEARELYAGAVLGEDGLTLD